MLSHNRNIHNVQNVAAKTMISSTARRGVGVRGRKHKHIREGDESTSAASQRRGGTVRGEIQPECVSASVCVFVVITKRSFLATVNDTNSKNHLPAQ